MTKNEDAIRALFNVTYPYNHLSGDAIETCVSDCILRNVKTGEMIYNYGDRLPGLFLIQSGKFEISDTQGEVISELVAGNSFAERGLSGDGTAINNARALQDGELVIIPVDLFDKLVRRFPEFATRFHRNLDPRPKAPTHDASSQLLEEIMTRHPASCESHETIEYAAKLMRDKRISSLCILEGTTLSGILTVRDISNKVVAEGRANSLAVNEIMTPNPITLPQTAFVSDAMHKMVEARISHIPVTKNNALVGIVTQTDLTRLQAEESSSLVASLARAKSPKDIAKLTKHLPQLLVKLVSEGRRHDVVTRLITDIADAATRRLLSLAEYKLGQPPCRYLWLACGSQGRREQTGVSDQDNCLILDDRAGEKEMAYFQRLAKFVSDGLNLAGYVYCPGDMMATNPKWCQPLRVWQGYFHDWIVNPVPEAQMLASVMFDLRPIGGDESLFEGLQHNTLRAASKNSIFYNHMVSNAQKHSVPLGLMRGIATIRSGEHKNQVDLKHNGVVPVVDLGRLYALSGEITEVNTRARLEAARDAGLLSERGGADLLDAYDMIANLRLSHQAAQIREGTPPDNYLIPAELSDFERSHLRNAFVVIKTLQSAVGYGNRLN